MESIKHFHCQLDLSNCNLLYDYEKSEFIPRPPGGDWDLGLLTSARSSSSGDESSQQDESRAVGIKLLDAAFTAKGQLEKDKRKADSKQKDPHPDPTENIIFAGNFGDASSSQLPWRVIPFFKPGDVIRGEVVLDLEDNLDAEKVTLSFKGAARVSVRVYTGKSAYDDVGREKYVSEETDLWVKSGGKLDDVTDSMQLLGSDGSKPQTSKQLTKGSHHFPFHFLLPQDAPAAVPPLLNSYSDYAHLVYRLKATIGKGKLWKRGNIVCSQGIWINSDMDISSIGSELSPVTVEEEMQTGLVRHGKVSIKATIPRRAYIPAETVPLALYIENTDTNEICSISARVVLGGRVRSGTGALRAFRNVSIKTTKITEGPLAGDAVQQYNMALPLEFEEMDSNLIPAGTLADCKLIDVKYAIVVKLKRKGLHRNLDMQIPITMGSFNSADVTDQET